MKFFNYFIGTIFITLAILLALVAYSSKHPDLLLKLLGRYDQGKFIGAYTNRNSGENYLVVAEQIDNETLSSEGTGFPVQVQKLCIIDLESMRISKIGLDLNTRIFGCDEHSIWCYDKQLKGINLKGGTTITLDQIIKKHPELKNELVDKADFYFFDEDKKQLLLKTKSGLVYELSNELQLLPRQHSAPANRIINENGKTTYYLAGEERKILRGAGISITPVFINGQFLHDSQTGKALGLPDSFYISHQRDLTDTGFYISKLNSEGKIRWQFHSNQCAANNRYTAQLVWARRYAATLLLLIQREQYLQLVVLDEQKGRLIQQSIL